MILHRMLCSKRFFGLNPKRKGMVHFPRANFNCLRSCSCWGRWRGTYSTLQHAEKLKDTKWVDMDSRGKEESSLSSFDVQSCTGRCLECPSHLLVCQPGKLITFPPPRSLHLHPSSRRAPPPSPPRMSVR